MIFKMIVFHLWLQALAGVPREAYYISSKVSRYERLGSKELVKSEESIFSGFEQTLKNLGLDYVDIVIVRLIAVIYFSITNKFKNNFKLLLINCC